MKLTKSLAIVMAATMLLSSLSACGSANSKQSATAGNSAAGAANTSEAKLGKTDIVLAQKSDIKSTDPHVSNDTTTHVVLEHLYNSLLTIAPDGTIQGDLAKEWTQVSPTEWKFVLNEGVKFHDGTELKASDVKFSLEREKASARLAQKVEVVQEVKVDGDYTFSLILSKPYAPLLVNLAHPGSSILSEKAVTSAGDKYAENPIGTGPMKFKEWVPNDHITLVRNDDYFEGAGRTTSMTIRVIPEGPSRTISLETGEVDIVPVMEKVDVPRVKEDKNLTAFVFPSTTVEYFAMNTQKAPFDNVKVRQAMNYAINKQDIITVSSEGLADPVDTLISSQVRSYNDQVTHYDFNPDKAKALLAEAGYPNGFSTTIFVSGDVRNRTAQLIQANLATIGVTADIELYEWGAFLDAINAGQHATFISGWSNSSLDPDESFNPLFHTKNAGATGNRSFYSNPEVDALLEAAETEADDAKRMQLYSDIQVKVVDDAPWVPLFCAQTCMGARAGLDGLNPHPVVSSTKYYDVCYLG